MTKATAEQEIRIKKLKFESLLADKMTSRGFAVTAKKTEADKFLTEVLEKDIERYSLEIEAIQAFIEGIDLELTKHAKTPTEVEYSEIADYHL